MITQAILISADSTRRSDLQWHVSERCTVNLENMRYAWYVSSSAGKKKNKGGATLGRGRSH